MLRTLRLRTKSTLLAVLMATATSQAASANPKSVVVSVPGPSTSEIKAYATSQDSLTLSESLEASRPGADRSTELKKRFENAQRHWLGGDVEQARSEFRALGELALKADWKGEQRTVLLTAYLRLAQSASSGTERSAWLDSAVRYYSDLTPDAALFPPPLLTEYRETQRRMLEDAVELDARDIFPDARFVLIDGRVIDTTIAKLSKVPPGVHRITALSDTHAAVTEFLTGQQLRLFRAVPPLLVEGICATARLKANSDLGVPAEANIYRGRNCPAEGLQLKPQLLSRNGVSTEFANAPAPEKSSTQALKKNWLWIVGGALVAAAGYAIARDMNRDEKPTTVHRSGF